MDAATQAALEKLVEVWRDEARVARERSNKAAAELSSVFHAGKCIAYENCVEHLLWYMGTLPKEQAP